MLVPVLLTWPGLCGDKHDQSIELAAITVLLLRFALSHTGNFWLTGRGRNLKGECVRNKGEGGSQNRDVDEPLKPVCRSVVQLVTTFLAAQRSNPLWTDPTGPLSRPSTWARCVQIQSV